MARILNSFSFFVQLIPVNVPSLLVLQIRYNCTRDGCTSSDVDKKLVEEPPNTNDPTIIVYRVNNVVRGVSAPSGVEKWNLSVHQYELCLLTGGIPTPTTAVQKTSPICNLPLGTPNTKVLRDYNNRCFETSVILTESVGPIYFYLKQASTSINVHHNKHAPYKYENKTVER
ncbi:unnamed protein product [Schistosoma mattheei]|uniref:Uncharacterized protein n=1 Tax=Schistosoma mattheei TaxID=31246 RepID=A0A183NM44_9TREM|nr:unnamed protein product [Schistosoma mattheei]